MITSMSWVPIISRTGISRSQEFTHDIRAGLGGDPAEPWHGGRISRLERVVKGWKGRGN